MKNYNFRENKFQFYDNFNENFAIFRIFPKIWITIYNKYLFLRGLSRELIKTQSKNQRNLQFFEIYRKYERIFDFQKLI